MATKATKYAKLSKGQYLAKKRPQNMNNYAKGNLWVLKHQPHQKINHAELEL